MTSDMPLEDNELAAGRARQLVAINRKSWGGAPLTRDNFPISRPTPTAGVSQFGEIYCTEILPDAVAGYVRDSLSENTRRAYRSDLDHFARWGGSIPSTDREIATYLAEQARTLKVATIVRRLSSISKAHDAVAAVNPTRTTLVRATLRGLKRSRGTAQRQARPLLKEELFDVLEAMGDGLKDVRDRALLLIGFAGGFRRSELVAIDVEDVETVRQGIIIHLRRSKTDQVSAGRQIGIPLGRSRWCPVTALEEWLSRAGITDGPIFRRVDRHSRVHNERLSGEAVSLGLKSRMEAAGFEADGFSGHSLRAGFVTSAAQAGVSTWKIRQQTGHRSDAMLNRYVRIGELFLDNGAGALL